jgi:hypothetical protein
MLTNTEPEKQAGQTADVLKVLGRPELDKDTLNRWRLSRQDAWKYNRVQEQVSDLMHRATQQTPSNTVCCVSMATDGRTPVAAPLLKRGDVRVMEKEELDMNALRLAYRRAQQRPPDEHPDLEGSNGRLLHWAITRAGLVKTRTDPHLASSGDVLPMRHVVLLIGGDADAKKTARCIALDGAQAFNQALGPLVVFKARLRAKRTDNGLEFYVAAFNQRVRDLALLLDPEVAADGAVDDDDMTEPAVQPAKGNDDDDEYDDAKERRKSRKSGGDSKKKKKKTRRPKKAPVPKKRAATVTTSDAGGVTVVFSEPVDKKIKLSPPVDPGYHPEELTDHVAPQTVDDATMDVVRTGGDPFATMASAQTSLLKVPPVDFNDFFSNYESRLAF